jgi:hypothetical protein
MEAVVPTPGDSKRRRGIGFLVAHEAFHYLRRTKQVERRHGEIEADAFGMRMLEQYGEESNTREEVDYLSN